MHPSCAYCDKEATHYGQGEYVCADHINHDARGEYFPTPA